MWLGMDAAPVIQTGHHVRVKQDSALSETRNSVSRLFKRKRWQSFQLTCQSQQMWEGCWSPEVAVKMFACIVDTRVLQQRDVCVQSLQAVDCLMLIVDCWLLIHECSSRGMFAYKACKRNVIQSQNKVTGDHLECIWQNSWHVKMPTLQQRVKTISARLGDSRWLMMTMIMMTMMITIMMMIMTMMKIMITMMTIVTIMMTIITTWVGVGVTGSSWAFTLRTPQTSRISWRRKILYQPTMLWSLRW